MSEYAVERARQIFQARQSRPVRPRRRTAADAAETEPGETPGGDARAGELIGALHLLHTRIRQLDGWLREEHCLNLTEMHVLSVISTAPPGRSTAGRGDAAARLAGEVGLSPSGLTRLVDRLVARGLLSRVDDVWDRRVTHPVLTDQGRTVRDAVLPRAVERILDSCEDGVQVPLEWLRGGAPPVPVRRSPDHPDRRA